MHIITFLSNVKKFTHKHGITSNLVIDKGNELEDVFSNAETAGGLIAGMQNDMSETIEKLKDYYIQTGNKKLLARLEKLEKAQY